MVAVSNPITKEVTIMNNNVFLYNNGTLTWYSYSTDQWLGLS